MTLDSVNLNELILTIHSAVLTDSGWNQVNHALCRALSAEQAVLLRATWTASAEPWLHLIEFDPQAAVEYSRDFGPQDVWLQGAKRMDRFGVGLVSVDSQLVDQGEFGHSVFYNEYLKRFDIERMMNICLAGPDPDAGYGPIAMNFYRGIGKEPFSTREVELLTHLAPHLTMAAQNYWAAQSLRLRANAQDSALNALTSAVFGVDAAGCVIFMNSSGEELTRQKRWLQLNDGVLEPAKSTVTSPELAAALHRLSKGLAFKVIATDAATGAQAIISGAPIPPCEASPYSRGAKALVWLTPLVPMVDPAGDLARLFGLTLAEKRLVSRLTRGEDVAAAAGALNVSVHTARTQLKAIFAKTGRRTQSSLLSLVVQLSILRTGPR